LAAWCNSASSHKRDCMCALQLSSALLNARTQHGIVTQLILRTLIVPSLAYIYVSNLECRAKMPRIVAAWLRCYVMVNVVYFLTGGMWAYYVYVCWGDKFFAPGNMPALRDMGEQIKVRDLNMLNSDSNSCWLPTIFCKMCWPNWSRLLSGDIQLT
jgi:hypothetical protein